MDEYYWIIPELRRVAEEIDRWTHNLMATASKVRAMANEIQELENEDEDEPPWVDITDEIPVNPNPTAPPAWWIRSPDEITGITIHHTLSHNPINVARYVIEQRGRPSIPYHLWVSRHGEMWLCAPLEWGMWHDHTGHKNINISIGMAGHLHKVRPPLDQMHATARLVAYLMDVYGIEKQQVQGHDDRVKSLPNVSTQCPGWRGLDRWREDFYRLVNEMIISF